MHKDKVYEGMHPGIIDRDLWDRAQSSLDENMKTSSIYEKKNTLLQGLIHDEAGSLYTPVHTKNDGGPRYIYYVNTKIYKGPGYKGDTPARIPAPEIENLIKKLFSEKLEQPDQIALLAGVNMLENIDALSGVGDHKMAIKIDALIRQSCQSVVIGKNFLKVKVRCKDVSELLNKELQISLPPPHEDQMHEITTAWRISRSKKGAIRINARSEYLSKDDPFNRPDHEIQKWVKGVVWREQHFKGKSTAEIARAENIDRRYVSRLIMQSLQIG